MKVELQIENVVTKTECYKTFDVDALVKYNGAFRDIGFPPAKFRFMRPKKQVTVNVYKTGKIICLGAKSIERAIEYTERIMKKLDITDSSEITVTRVMMSGHFVEKVNVYNAIPLIEKASRFIGIDCNTTGHAAVVAIPHTGKIHKLGKSAIHTHSKYKAVRKKLQRQGKFSLLKKIKNKESRIVKNINHHVSKKIVEIAASEKSGIRFENLKGIRKNKKQHSKNFRYSLNSWSYYQIQQLTEYKARSEREDERVP